VTATIDYRLRPNDTPEEQLAAASDAIDDAMESVRWLKAHAAAYGIDTGRIGVLGSSAGGAIALGVALAEDPTPGGPLAAFSPHVAAGVSTGAHLTPGLAVIDLEPTDSPVMMFHFDQDTSRDGATWDYAYQTCAAVHAAGNVCDAVRQPGSGHTVAIGPTGKWWAPEIGPFLWHHLRLAAP
jgi:dienelactone hydrolase